MLQIWNRQLEDAGYQYGTPLPSTAGNIAHDEQSNLERSIGELAPFGLRLSWGPGALRLREDGAITESYWHEIPEVRHTCR